MYHLIYHKRNSAFFRICTLNNCILIQKICILNTANLYKNTEDLYFKYRKSVLKYRLLTTLAHHTDSNKAISVFLALLLCLSLGSVSVRNPVTQSRTQLSQSRSQLRYKIIICNILFVLLCDRALL